MIRAWCADFVVIIGEAMAVAVRSETIFYRTWFGGRLIVKNKRWQRSQWRMKKEVGVREIEIESGEPWKLEEMARMVQGSVVLNAARGGVTGNKE